MNVLREVKVERIYEGGSHAVPDGFEFLDFEFGIENGYTAIFALYQKSIPLQEWKDVLEKQYLERNKAHEEDMKVKLNEAIGKLSLEQKFSDLIQKFKIGDSAYFYEPEAWGRPGEHQDRIKRMTISSIYLEAKNVGIRGDDEEEGDVHLIVKGWNEMAKATEIYATKEEAMEQTKTRHDQLVLDYELAEKKKEEQREEKRRQEELEILKRAEEIKSKQSPDPIQ